MSSQIPGSNPVVAVILEVVAISSQSIEPMVHSSSKYSSGVHISWGNHCISGTLCQILNELLMVQKQAIAHLKARSCKFLLFHIYFLEYRIKVGVVEP
jgi:hypothetical protein